MNVYNFHLAVSTIYSTFGKIPGVVLSIAFLVNINLEHLHHILIMYFEINIPYKLIKPSRKTKNLTSQT